MMDAANGESSSSSSSSLSPPPESFFVFVVGNCEEWPENRDTQGDAAIYQEYLNFGVPPDQCVYIKDDECTRNNCQEQLENFLRRRQNSSLSSSSSSSQAQTQPQQQQKLRNNNNSSNNDNDTQLKQQQQQQHQRQRPQPQQETKIIPTTLVFHYGGHGTATGFATIGSTWTYRQVAQTIEEFFHGDRVLFLLDCCASGNLWQHLPSSSCKQYVLLATSQPYNASSAEGEEWILTHSWIQLMCRRSPNGNNGIRNTATEETDNEGVDLPLEKLISLLADRHAFELGDLFFAYLTTPKSTSTRNNCWSWMPPARCRQPQYDSSSSLSPVWLPSSKLSPNGSSRAEYQIPHKGKILSVYDCRVGDAVAYKHPGGQPISIAASSFYGNSSSNVIQERLPFYVPPLWLHATIVAIFEIQHRTQDEGEVEKNNLQDNILLRIKVQYPSQPHEPWEVDVLHDQLLNHFFVTQQWMLPKAFRKTQVMLAQKYWQYLDCSVAAHTPVRVVTVPEQQADNCDDNNQDTIVDSRPTAKTKTKREGTILDWKDYDWKNLLYNNNSSASAGSNVFPGKTNYDQYYFHELPVPIKIAAVTLGYTKSNWDDDTDIPADSQDWDELTEVQKEAATLLGYVRQKPSTDLNMNSGMQNASEISTSAGAHVPVEWNDNHQSSLVPLTHIVFSDATTKRHNNRTSTIEIATTTMIASSIETRQPDDEEEKIESLQRQSLIRSLKSIGKSIGNAESIFGTTKLSAYWPHDEVWYDAAPIDIVCSSKEEENNQNSHNELSLNLLATHFEYQLSGIYCPIMYEDGIRCLVPLNHIFKRGCQPQTYEGHDDDDHSSLSTERSSSSPQKYEGDDDDDHSSLSTEGSSSS